MNLQRQNPMASIRPKRVKKTTVEEIMPEGGNFSDAEETTPFDVSLEAVEDTEALKDVLDQFGETNVNLKIFRSTPSGPEFCFQNDHLDEEFIQKNFGGGDYQVRIFINGKYRKTIKVKIASRVSDASLPNAGVSAPFDRHSEFLEKLILAFVTKESQSTSSLSPSLADMISALQNLDNLRGKQESAMETFLKGVEFAKDLSGHTDWKTDLIRMGKEAIPDIKDMILGKKEAITNPNSTQSQLPQPE